MYGYNMMQPVATIYNTSFPQKTPLYACLPLKNLDWAACHLGFWVAWKANKNNMP